MSETLKPPPGAIVTLPWTEYEVLLQAEKGCDQLRAALAALEAEIRQFHGLSSHQWFADKLAALLKETPR